jgi:two-component system, NtrC family, sensor histidine kinase KinB
MLRTRLFLNLVPFVVMLLAVGVFAVVLFSRLAGSVDVTVTENYRSVVAAQTMNLALLRMQTAVLLVFDKQPDLGRALFAENRTLFEQNLELQSKSATLPTEKELSGQLAGHFGALRQAGIKIFSETRLPDQRQIYDAEFYPKMLAITVLLQRIRTLNHEAILATSQSIQKITRNMTHLMVLGMATALLISAYACYQLSRSILKPIQALSEATRELGEGNPGRLVPVNSRDELGNLAVAFNRMAAQLQEYRQSTTEKIVQLHRTMEATLASFADPIFVLNNEGQVELKNPAASDLASSLHLNNKLPARLQSIAGKTLESGESFLPHSFNEVVHFRLRGEDRFFLPRILAMRNKEETLFGVAVVLYDVTRFRLLDAVKTNLVATVSHELKTPLTSVRMVLHILLENTVGGLTPKQTELLQTARDDTERLLRILNDLLDLTRLEEDNEGLHKEPVAPVELLQSAMAEISDQALAKTLKMNCVPDPDLPAVSVDRQRINHVFTNLISNAIKHSPVGGEIVLRAARVGDDSVQFSISDEGAGIPEEYHTRIFDRFFRVPGQTKTGAGLGLSIAREITMAHGGRIGVRNSSRRGSTFYVVLSGAETSSVQASK